MEQPFGMKRFWKDVSVIEADGGWRVALDGKPIRTQGGAAQVVPTEELAEALAKEWRGQGEEVDAKAFGMRDLADYAIDHLTMDRDTAIADILRYVETDTLCYRADPDEPLHRRQLELWEPPLEQIEEWFELRFERTSGVVHRPQRADTISKLRQYLEGQSPFTLAALKTISSLAASATIALLALDYRTEPHQLWDIANCEEDWQAEQWGWDPTAKMRRATRFGDFLHAIWFARFARFPQNRV